MKKPIFTEQQRRELRYIEFELLKLALKRELEKSNLGQLIKRFVKWNLRY